MEIPGLRIHDETFLLCIPNACGKNLLTEFDNRLIFVLLQVALQKRYFETPIFQERFYRANNIVQILEMQQELMTQIVLLRVNYK